MVIDPSEFERHLDALEKALGRRKALHVNSAAEIARIRAVILTWFESLRARVEAQGLPYESLEAVDTPLRGCMELTLQRSQRTRYRSLIRQASRAFKRHVLVPVATRATQHRLSEPAESVMKLLGALAPGLAVCYQQVLADLADPRRMSYRGPANELREILREVLERLAPNVKVMARPWYEPVDGRREPTQQQRARYILEVRSAGSKVHRVASTSLTVVEEGLSKLVRDIYTRTSVAAHTAQDLAELGRMLRHFDAIIHELCPA